MENEEKIKEQTDLAQEEEEHKCDDCSHKEEEDKKTQRIAELTLKILDLESQLSTLKKDKDKQIFEFIDKKTKEAQDLINKKEAELKEKYSSEFENAKKYLYESQFSDLVEIIAQFENVINSITDPSVSSYLVGFKMFLSKFDSLLKNLGITYIDPKENDDFDSEIMEVSGVKDINDKKLDNKISRLVLKGYKLQDRVIKLASVEVYKII